MHKLPRKKALDLIRAAGAQDDRKAFVRLYVENRISRAAADKAWLEGKRFGTFLRQRDAA